MGKKSQKKSPAVRELERRGISFSLHPYDFEEHGGAPDAARKLGADPHHVIKTLVMATADKQPFLMLMHGDREVSQKALARELKTKSVSPVDPKTASLLTGYMVGGISPLGTRKKLPVFMEAGILELETIYVNAGRRGLLARLGSQDLFRATGAVSVKAAISV